MIRKRENNSTKILIIKPVYEAWPVGYAYVLACFEQNGIPFDFRRLNISAREESLSTHTNANVTPFIINKVMTI